MKRILCIIGSMDIGGAETFLMKIYRSLDKTKFQMDFCVAKREENFYEREIKDLGGRVYKITPKSRSMVKNFKEIKDLVKKNGYNSVLRVSQHSLSSIELLAAKRGGAKKLIYRASNSNSCGGVFGQLTHYLFRHFANLISNVKIAPSNKAAVFMFGKKMVKSNKVLILNNAIDVEKYRFNKKDRKKIREELKIPYNTKVIGNVGRLSPQKNQLFLIDIFNSWAHGDINKVLLIVGKGELRGEIEKAIADNTSRIILLEPNKNIESYYSAMDAYVFPSKYEGMPNTVIEAQANGLPCLVADTIDRKIKINNNLEFEDINESREEWGKRLDALKRTYDQKKIKQNFKESGYDINCAIQIIESILY